MPEDDHFEDLNPEQRRSLSAMIAWFRHEMANLGFGTLGPARDDTLKNNWFLNEERKRFEMPSTADDRKWVSDTRVWWLTEDQQEIRRQLLEEHKRRKKWADWRGAILTAVIGAVMTAAILALFIKAPALLKVIWP